MESVEKKLIGRIIYFASRFGKKSESEIVIEIPLKHDFIAQSINVARENVTRELRKLKNKNLISLHKGKLVVLNLTKLERMLEEK